MKLSPQLIQKLSGTSFCLSGISTLAEQFEQVDVNEISSLVAQLTEQGEDLALNRLLNACAYAGLRLDPTRLAESAVVIADMLHLPYCYFHQGAEAIEPLIKMARAETLSHQRQALLGRLAAELALRYESHQSDVEHLLQYLCGEIGVPPTSLLVLDSIHLLDQGQLEEGMFPIFTEKELRDVLPDRAPPRIIGGGETIRRPIPKRGRNERCHCGSGKKYKRCCIEKDQAILADASAYEGITQSQLAENPGIVDDVTVIHDLRAYEIKKLVPSQLASSQLMPAYQKACGFGLLEVAFNFLDEYSKRPDPLFPFVPEHFADLMECALDQHDLELAQRARARAPHDADLISAEEIEFQIDLQANPGHLSTIEARCKDAFCHPSEEGVGLREHGLCELAHLLSNRFPALSILFARAAVQEGPEHIFDNDLLVDTVHQARLEMGLSPWGDPIDAWFNEQEQRGEEQALQSQLAAETATLRKQLAESRDKIRAAETGLRKKEARLTALTNELKATSAQQQAPAVAAEQIVPPIPASALDTEMRLRRQIENLKVEIGNQQEKRQQLRQELKQERNLAQQASSVQGASQERGDAVEENVMPERPAEMARTLLLPTYHNHFQGACQSVPPAIADGALRAITSFALYDPAVWRSACRVKQLSNIYRVRIGRNYRLLLCWIPGEKLTALDLIPRQDLESWIRRHA